MTYWRNRFLTVTHKANYLGVIAMMSHNYLLAGHLGKYSYYALNEYQHHDYIQAIAILSMLEYEIGRFGNGHSRQHANFKIF